MEEDLIVLRFENSQLFEMRHRTKQINVLLPGLVVLVPMWAIRMGGIHDVLRCSNAVRSETGAHQRFWGCGRSAFQQGQTTAFGFATT